MDTRRLEKMRECFDPLLLIISTDGERTNRPMCQICFLKTRLC